MNTNSAFPSFSASSLGHSGTHQLYTQAEDGALSTVQRCANDVIGKTPLLKIIIEYAPSSVIELSKAGGMNFPKSLVDKSHLFKLNISIRADVLPMIEQLRCAAEHKSPIKALFQELYRANSDGLENFKAILNEGSRYEIDGQRNFREQLMSNLRASTATPNPSFLRESGELPLPSFRPMLGRRLNT